MEDITRKRIISLIHREVVPAIGCTEPMAVALCVAKAKEILGDIPDSIDAYLSANILKNAMGVGIPGTGMIGLPIAIALGAIIGKSDYGLEVLKDLHDDTLQQGKDFIDSHAINIQLKEGIHHFRQPYPLCLCRQRRRRSSGRHPPSYPTDRRGGRGRYTAEHAHGLRLCHHVAAR